MNGTQSSIQVRDAVGVREVTINRPEKFNALSGAMMTELAMAIAGAAAADASLVVIRGSGERAFCAGADLNEIKTGGDVLAAQEHALEDLAAALEGSPVPVISIVHARALGAGVLIAGLSDLVIARADSTIGFPEMQFGLYPAIVHAALLPRLSSSTLFQLCAGARTLSAPAALELGLVTEVLPVGGFEAAATERIAYYFERSEGLRLGRELRAEAIAGSVRERLNAVADRAARHFRSDAVQRLLASRLAPKTGGSAPRGSSD